MTHIQNGKILHIIRSYTHVNLYVGHVTEISTEVKSTMEAITMQGIKDLSLIFKQPLSKHQHLRFL